MEYLKSKKVPSHFVKRMNDREQLIKKCEIIPIEFVTRNVVAGSIAEKLGLIDVQKASEVSGSRFSYLFGDLVKIEFNLVSWALDILSNKGFTPTVPPVLVRENALYGTGFFPDDAEQVYEIPNDDLYLVEFNVLPPTYIELSLHKDWLDNYGKELMEISYYQFFQEFLLVFCCFQNSYQSY